MQTAEDQFQFFEGVFFESFGRDLQVNEYRLIQGGSINVTVQVLTNEGKYFIKYNTRNYEGMFETEAKGLDLLRETNVIRVPEVIHWGRRDGQDYLVLENIEYSKPNFDYWESLGQKLASLHRNTADSFGLSFDNYIGSLRQSNEQKSDWLSFFIEKRLNVQAGLAYYNELISKSLYDKFQQFYKVLPELIPNEPASLLHGDLWSGNVITDEKGEPSLIDPSVYYGSREMEIAFTNLFGGFDKRFYDSYQEAYPLQPRFDERVPIYNIYPLLVHTNIFGTSYLPPIIRTLNRYL
ncbi:Fructosamine/Ketosamine-3-kinase [Emticicia oligotrophica DSM 17448]|uniref:Fructosamine/Ketosamine-3-kinase n=1 Tax=Emticicia oligotrophica (strain DSM 17448 / CIP 109782 / MTCC 6937 / GPTSA100-15) TaxID=929562 RepID=A0ABM5N047_EMTOG|nr:MULTISPECIES: fructosamine kinase family protein [Emticicia]AFK02759.1 Fructosamine/Ketosamine-3-kinase [Emticicia oligotrophica DSM 17448]